MEKGQQRKAVRVKRLRKAEKITKLLLEIVRLQNEKLQALRPG